MKKHDFFSKRTQEISTSSYWRRMIFSFLIFDFICRFSEPFDGAGDGFGTDEHSGFSAEGAVVDFEVAVVAEVAGVGGAEFDESGVGGAAGLACAGGAHLA